MIALLALIPWVLTVGALLFMIIKNNNKDFNEEDMEDYGHDIIRVAVYDDKAYWVHNNTFYESDVVREPDFTTARPIDTMELPTKKLNELLNILDELEQNNERD